MNPHFVVINRRIGLLEATFLVPDVGGQEVQVGQDVFPLRLLGSPERHDDFFRLSIPEHPRLGVRVFVLDEGDRRQRPAVGSAPSRTEHADGRGKQLPNQTPVRLAQILLGENQILNQRVVAQWRVGDGTRQCRARRSDRELKRLPASLLEGASHHQCLPDLSPGDGHVVIHEIEHHPTRRPFPDVKVDPVVEFGVRVSPHGLGPARPTWRNTSDRGRESSASAIASRSALSYRPSSPSRTDPP